MARIQLVAVGLQFEEESDSIWVLGSQAKQCLAELRKIKQLGNGAADPRGDLLPRRGT